MSTHAAPLATVTVHPLPPATGPPKAPDSEGGVGDAVCVGWFAKLRGPPADRAAAAAAAEAAAAAAAQPGQPTPPARSVHTRTYSFVFNAASTFAPFRPPRVPLDLNAGYPDGYVSPPGYRVGVEEVALAAVEAGGGAAAFDGDGDARPLIVTYRNNLRKIVGTAFDPGNEWAVDAVALPAPSGGDGGGGGAAATRPLVFLDIVQLPAAWESNNPDSDRFTYWGYKFEALCAEAAAADGGHAWASDAGGGVDAAPLPARHGRAEWAALLRRSLGPVDLLFAAETDGFCPDLAAARSVDASSASGSRAPVVAPGTPPVPLSATVEVKTLKWPASPGAAAALFKRKAPTWWLQSYLAGCAEVWLGVREGDGTLTHVDRIPVADVPAWAARQGGAAWCPAAILDSGGRMLEWMAGVAGRAPGQTVRFRYEPPRREREWRGGGGGRGHPRHQQQQAPGVLTARVVEDGGDLARRVRAAVDEGVLLP